MKKFWWLIGHSDVEANGRKKYNFQKTRNFFEISWNFLKIKKIQMHHDKHQNVKFQNVFDFHLRIKKWRRYDRVQLQLSEGVNCLLKIRKTHYNLKTTNHWKSTSNLTSDNMIIIHLNSLVLFWKMFNSTQTFHIQKYLVIWSSELY